MKIHVFKRKKISVIIWNMQKSLFFTLTEEN